MLVGFGLLGGRGNGKKVPSITVRGVAGYLVGGRGLEAKKGRKMTIDGKQKLLLPLMARVTG